MGTKSNSFRCAFQAWLRKRLFCAMVSVGREKMCVHVVCIVYFTAVKYTALFWLWGQAVVAIIMYSCRYGGVTVLLNECSAFLSYHNLWYERNARRLLLWFIAEVDAVNTPSVLSILTVSCMYESMYNEGSRGSLESPIKSSIINQSY